MISGREGTLQKIYEVYSVFGVPLVIKTTFNQYAFGVYSDDLGVFLYAPIVAYITGLDVISAAHLLIRLLGIAFFLLTLAPFLFMARSWVARVIIVFIHISFFIKILAILDVYIAYVFALAPVSFFLFSFHKKSMFLLSGSFFLIGLFGFFSHVMRKYSFLPLLFLTATIFIFSKDFNKKQKARALLFLCLGISVPLLHYSYSLYTTGEFLKNKGCVAVNLNPGYGIWHGTYMGFGFLQNNHGIIRHDGCSEDKAREIDPSVRAGKPDCERIMRSLIYNLFRADRHFVLTSFFAKIGVAFMFFLVWFGWVALIFSYFYPKHWYEDLGFFFAGLFGYLPGILTIPDFQYLAGGITVTLLYALYSLVIAFNKGFLDDLKDVVKAFTRRIKLDVTKFI